MDESNSIQLTDDVLLKIEDMSSCLMSPSEIALSVDIQLSKFMHILKHKHDHPIYIAFQKGRIKTKLDVHRMVISLAKRGSPQAEQLTERFLRNQNNESI